MTHPPKIGPAEIMQMAIAFWGSQTLFAGLELGVFEALQPQPASANQLAITLTLPAQTLERLMIALTALGLLEKEGDLFKNSPAASTFLVRNNATYLGGNFGHLHHEIYPLWGHLADAVREDSPRWQQTFGPTASNNPFETMYSDPERLRNFLAAMNIGSAPVVREIIADFDLTNYNCLLDVGGALGTLVIAAVARYPHLKGIVFDLPPVAPLATDCIAHYGLSERIEVVAGDMFTDAIPPKADIISLSCVLHDWDDVHCQQILKNCYNALPAGGTIMILEKLINDEKTGPLWPALLSLNMLVATLGGRERTAAEYLALLTEAGFTDPLIKVLPGMRDYITARKR